MSSGIVPPVTFGEFPETHAESMIMLSAKAVLCILAPPSENQTSGSGYDSILLYVVFLLYVVLHIIYNYKYIDSGYVASLKLKRLLMNEFG